MIVCRACGSRNPDGEEFCSHCGRYLEWSGERVEEEHAPEPELEPEPEPEPEAGPGFFTRVRRALGGPREVAPPPARVSGLAPPSPIVASPSIEEPAAPAPPPPSPNEDPRDLSPASAPPPFARRSEAAEADRPIAPVVPLGAPGPPGPSGDDLTEPSPDARAEPATLMLVPPIEEEGGDAMRGEPAPSPAASEATQPLSVIEPIGAGSPGAPAPAGGAAVAPPGTIALRRPGDPPPPPVPTPVPTAAESDDSVDAADDPVERPDRGLALRRPTEITQANRPRRRHAARLLPEPPATRSPGDVTCPGCGQFNAPRRVFCRRCGMDLSLAAAAEPEYLRERFLTRHFRRDVRIVSVGDRPGRWGRTSSGGHGSERYMHILGRAGAVLIGAGLILSFIGPVSTPIRTWVNNKYEALVHRLYVTYTQQFAISATASSSNVNHPPGLAVDDGSNTYWLSLPNAKTKGAGQTITAQFSSPTTIDYIGVLSGIYTSEQQFLKWSRPKEILISFPDGVHKQELLKNSSAFQRLNIHDANANSMTIKILSVYKGGSGNAVAITEIEFFQRT